MQTFILLFLLYLVINTELIIVPNYSKPHKKEFFDFLIYLGLVLNLLLSWLLLFSYQAIDVSKIIGHLLCLSFKK